jgi:cytochrome P450
VSDDPAIGTAGFDPLDPPPDPWPHLAALRSRSAVARFPERDLSVVLRYEEARAALRDTETYSSRVRPKKDPGEHTIQSTDPPDHSRLRKLINNAFTIERVRAFEPRIHAIAEGLADALDRSGAFDLVPGFTVPLPVTVIAELLGVPEGDHAQFKRWSDDWVHVAGGHAGESIGEFRTWARAQVLDRRSTADPPDDLLTAVALTEVDGERLDETSAAGLAVILVIAGNETTTNALGTAIQRLVSDPGLFERVRADRSLIPELVEETLRFDPPIPVLPRKATADTSLDGTSLTAGETLLVHLGAANRDPEVFADPDRFDIERRGDRAHIGFGYGAHTCVGAPLARAEMAIGINVILDRFPALQLARGRDVSQIGFFLLRGPASLWAEDGPR